MQGFNVQEVYQVFPEAVVMYEDVLDDRTTVDDFHNLSKNTTFTLDLCAMQDVSRMTWLTKGSKHSRLSRLLKRRWPLDV